MSRDFERRHVLAFLNPQGPEIPIVALIKALDTYVEQQEDAMDEKVPWRDYVLGAGVGQILDGIRTLLNGDLGRLDGGLLDQHLMDIAEHVGFDLDLMEMA